MSRFLKRVLLFFGIPIVFLVGLYVLTDPYKTLRKFSLEYFDDTNRDYLSSELWLLNYPNLKYDSYVFCSSRGKGINTYHWLKYLPDGSRQFLFQAWGETVIGMEQKIDYIDTQGYLLKNVILLLDYPDSFVENTQLSVVARIKHPFFSGQPTIVYQAILCWGFIQKPSQWLRSVGHWVTHNIPLEFDPLSNDWYGDNKKLDISVPPEKDSLRGCSKIARNTFLKDYEGKTSEEIPVSNPIIGKGIECKLKHIHEIFEKQNTDYKIVISPCYYQISPIVNEMDLKILHRIFGSDKVFDYSGKNYITEDYNNFIDPAHFGLWAGWHVIEEIYGVHLDFEITNY